MYTGKKMSVRSAQWMTWPWSFTLRNLFFLFFFWFETTADYIQWGWIVILWLFLRHFQKFNYAWVNLQLSSRLIFISRLFPRNIVKLHSFGVLWKLYIDSVKALEGRGQSLESMWTRPPELCALLSIFKYDRKSTDTLRKDAEQ